MTESPTNGLALERVSKRYGDTEAVRDVTLSIEEGEFAVLVGPSGCGKSTLLRAIAGLESIDGGDIRHRGRSIRDLPPRSRDLAMVFQSYALYPYLSVFENIAFGLRARGAPRADVNRRVGEAAERLGLAAHLERRPRELSGGQRQRVAIGRAIVRDAELFLFDEPLSNLDAKLRDEMREELKRLHQRLGKTFVYVTHDQIEAMTLADRIVLLRNGRIEQSGPPLSLYERPGTRFVAGFLGSPAMNQLSVTPSADGATASGGATSAGTPDPAGERPAGVELADGQVLGLDPASLDRVRAAGSALVLGVRPQDLHLVDEAGADLTGTVTVLQPTGSRLLASVMIGEQRLLADLPASAPVAVGERVRLRMDRRRLHFFDAGSGTRIDVPVAHAP